MIFMPGGIGRQAGANGFPSGTDLISTKLSVVMDDPRRMLIEVYVSVDSALKWPR